jgi:hypothetical protein
MKPNAVPITKPTGPPTAAPIAAPVAVVVVVPATFNEQGPFLSSLSHVHPEGHLLIFSLLILFDIYP